MDLFFTLYQSHALIPEDSGEHDKILAQCSTKNSVAELTGFLHREADTFVQYLEGPKAEVLAAVERIKKDPRHETFAVLAQGDISRRSFPDWQMGFVDTTEFSLSDMFEESDGTLDLALADPFDLVVYMAANADHLRDRMGRSAA